MLCSSVCAVAATRSCYLAPVASCVLSQLGGSSEPSASPLNERKPRAVPEQGGNELSLVQLVCLSVCMSICLSLEPSLWEQHKGSTGALEHRSALRVCLAVQMLSVFFGSPKCSAFSLRHSSS